MMKRIFQKMMTVICTAALLFGMVPVFSPPAKAADAGGTGSAKNVSSVDNTTLQSLGFSTSTSDINSQLTSGENPYGNGAVPMTTYNELGVTGSSGGFLPGNGTYLYDASQGNLSINGLGMPASGQSVLDNLQARGANTILPGTPAYEQSVAFDPGKTGAKDHVATVFAIDDSFDGDTIVYLIAGTVTGSAKTSFVQIGFLPFEIMPSQETAYLQIATGDFDGDGADEIAVYSPSNIAAGPCVQIYKYSDSGSAPALTLTKTKDLTSVAQNQLGLLKSDGSAPYYGGVYSGGNQWKNKEFVPGLSMTTVKQANDHVDDLAIVLNSPRDPDDSSRKNPSLASWAVFWVDPLASDAKVSSATMLEAKWDRYDSATPEPSYFDTMMDCGVGSGDIDGDGSTEVVVAGYRFSDTAENSTGRTLDKNWYDTLYFTYNASDKAYSVKSLPQWIDSSQQNNDLNNGFTDNNNTTDIMLAPLSVLCFSQHGSGKPASVMVNGLVLQADSQYAASPVDDQINQANYNEALRNADELPFKLTYTVPINQYISSNNISNEWMGDAVAGNFTKDHSGDNGTTALGIPQIIFTYCTKTTGGNYNYSVVGVRFNTDGSVAAVETTKVLQNTTDYAFGIYSCDVDGDSVAMRPTDQQPDYYFSDPHPIAILESAPYFRDLGSVNGNYPTVGSTSITNTSGSTTGTTYGGSVSAGITFGFEQDLSIIVKIGEISVKNHLDFSMSEDYESSKTVTKSFTFTGQAGEDMVALVSTPYVRYYYQVWNPSTKTWSPMTVDVPSQPRSTEISANRYDRVAAAHNSMSGSDAQWDLIHGNILQDTPGDPTTYPDTSNGLKNWAGGSTVGSGSTSDFVNVGSGSVGSTMSQEIEYGKDWSSTTTFGLSDEVETEGNIFGVVFGASAGISVTSGFTEAGYTGTTFNGTVAVLPEGTENQYGFSWQFGVWEASLDHVSVPVLGYLVTDVRAPLPSPAGFNVTGSTSNSITLQWDKAGGTEKNVTGYALYRLENSLAIQLAGIPAQDPEPVVYTYTDYNLRPGSSYQYEIRAVGPGGVGALAGPITGYTDTSPGASPTVTDPEDLSAPPGTDGFFSVKAAPAVAGDPLYYDWQQYTDDTGWQDISGADAPAYNFVTNMEMSGTKYRCIVAEWIGGEAVYTTSRAAILSLDNYYSTNLSFPDLPTQTTVGTPTAIHVTLAKRVQDGYTTAKPGTVTLTFHNQADGASTANDTSVASDLSSGTSPYTWNASPSWTPTRAGNYTVAASFSHDPSSELLHSTAAGTIKVAAAPTITLSGDTSTPAQSDSLSVAVDPGSGDFTNLSVSDGTSSHDITGQTGYTITQNGTYTFTATNSDNLTTQKQITIANIDTAKPVLSVSAGNHYQSGAWAEQPVTLTLANTNAQNLGTTSYSYSTDNGTTWKTAQGGTVTVSTDGTTGLLLKATSRTGVDSDTASFTVRLDTTGPALGLIAPTGWKNGAADVAVSAGDSGSGIQSVVYTTNETNPQKGAVALDGSGNGSIALTGEGSYTLTVTATDNAGNATTKTVPITIDDTKPLLTATAPTGWQKGDVTVGIDASDVPSGIRSITYSTDEASPETGSVTLDSSDKGSILMQNEGGYTLTVTATDNAGNTFTQYVTIQIDKTAPGSPAIGFSATPKTVSGFATWQTFFNGAVNAAVEATDAGSGIDHYEVQTVAGTGAPNGSAWQTGAFALLQPGFKGTVYARAVDKAGNVSATASQTVVVDGATPVIDAGASPLVTYDKQAAIPVDVTDGGAGIASISYTVNGGAAHTIDLTGTGCTDPTAEKALSIGSLPDGDYDVVITAADNAGNTSAAAVHVTKDTSPRVTGVTVTPGNAALDHGAAQTFTAGVVGTNNPSAAVVWGVAGAKSAGTSIDQNGKLTVASDEPAAALTVTATSAADQSKSDSVSVSINPSSQTGFGFDSDSLTKTFSDAPFTVRATGGQGAGDVTYAVTSGNDVISIAGGTVNILKTGTAVITATKAADGSFHQTMATLTIQVAKAAPTITTPPTASQLLAAGPLSGSALSGGSASIPGTFSWTAPETDVQISGSYSVTFTPTDTADYTTAVCTVPVRVGTTITNQATSITADVSNAALPGGTTSVTLSVDAIPASGAGSDSFAAVEGLIGSDRSLAGLNRLTVYNIQLIDQNGNAIEPAGTVTVRLPIPDGMSGDLHVYWYDPSTGQLTDMGATQEDGCLVFDTTHFSYYAVAELKKSSGSAPSDVPNPKSGDRGTMPLIPWALLGGLGAVLAIARRRKMFRFGKHMERR